MCTCLNLHKARGQFVSAMHRFLLIQIGEGGLVETDIEHQSEVLYAS